MTKPGETCPIHGTILYSQSTKFGMRYACREPGCTVVGWDGPTSTPADQETRDARTVAHVAFDGLCRRPDQLMPRSEAYRRLSEFMKLPSGMAHIGMLDKADCKRVIDFVGSELLRLANEDAENKGS